jgi:hypothetical protein
MKKREKSKSAFRHLVSTKNCHRKHIPFRPFKD